MTSPWPLFDLRLRYRDLLLRPVIEADLPTLVRLFPGDLELDPSLPSDRALAVQQGYWRAQSQWSAEAWVLSFLVHDRGDIVGVQTLEGTDFPILRTVDSASWLVASARGRGTGKAMRAAVLDFAFQFLEAQAAVTSAWHDNAGSLGVSRSLGYLPNGEHWHRRGDRADTMLHLRMTRPRWSSVGVDVEGFERCRGFFGLRGNGRQGEQHG